MFFEGRHFVAVHSALGFCWRGREESCGHGLVVRLHPRTSQIPRPGQANAGDGEDVDDDEAAVQARLADYEVQLAKDEALAEAENNDPEVLLAVDAKALGTTTAALRALDIRKLCVVPRETVCTPTLFVLFSSC